MDSLTVADALMMTLITAHTLDIDPVHALRDKMERKRGAQKP